MGTNRVTLKIWMSPWIMNIRSISVSIELYYIDTMYVF